ncbi:MAG: hypothetical protein B6244_03025 [Candidatus Cloacimonetes bacterium 4572_55]|nr:MAG: hypothetical protein B6244_03025 [Candidatus Cloacimonetes bacterium 4572_55]
MKNVSLWVLAFLITIGAAVYQRMTGPTYPIKGELKLGSQFISYKLPRSHSSFSPLRVNLDIQDKEVTGELSYRRFPVDKEWTHQRMQWTDQGLASSIPNQPPAGKVQYYLTLTKGSRSVQIGIEDPIILRFKGDVPPAILIGHVLFMFMAMFFSNLTGLKAITKDATAKKYAWFTFICLTIGGMILGMIVQKYAFGELWTGVPFGWDLTDNKTLLAFISWAIAIGVNTKKDARWLYVAAAGILLLVYMIPHSFLGSELDYNTMNIESR